MKSTSLMVVLWTLAVAATLILFLANVFLGDLNQDEGWYLYAARLVAQGKLPYIDFAATQGPVMPFVYSAVQPLIDRLGVAGGRLFTAFLGFACALCAAWLAARLAPPRVGLKNLAAFTAFSLIGINVYQSYYCSIVKTYSLTGLLLILGFLALSFCNGARSSARACAAFGAGVLMSLAAGVRISAAVVLPIVFLFLGLKPRRAAADSLAGEARTHPIPTTYHLPPTTYHLPPPPLAWFWFGLGAALTCGVLFVPFLIKAPAALWFALVEYHAGREVGGALQLLAYKAGFVSRVVQAYFLAVALCVAAGAWKMVQRHCARAGASTSHTLQGVSMSPMRNYARAGADAQSGVSILRALWTSVAAVTCVHFFAPFPYDDYQVVAFPMFGVGVALMLCAAGGKLEGAGGKREAESGEGEQGRGWEAGAWPAVALFVLCVMSAFSSPLNQEWFVGKRDRIWWPLKKQSPLSLLRETGLMLRSMTQPGDALLTQDPYLAVESGLSLPEGLELGPFSYFPGWCRGKARACHVLNREMFVELLNNSAAPVAAFSGYGLAIRSPEVTELPEDEQRMLWDIVERRHSLFKEVENFGQAGGRLKIYVRQGSGFMVHGSGGGS